MTYRHPSGKRMWPYAEGVGWVDGAQVYETKTVRLSIDAHGAVHVASKVDGAAIIIATGS